MFSVLGLSMVMGAFGLVVATPSWGEEDAGKAHALLDKVKKGDLDRQIAVRQTEIERLKEDQTKTQADVNSLKQTIDSTNELITESSDALTKLTSENKRLEHEVAVTQARMNAERLKIEGLRILGSAQGKSLSALTRRLEESEARGQLRSTEVNMLVGGKPVPGSGREEKTETELLKARKTLALAESRTQSEERVGHDAMKVAATKMSAAEASAARADHLAEIDPLAPAPIAEKVKTKAAGTHESEEPVRRATPVAAPKPAPATAPKATPAPASRSGLKTPPPIIPR